MIGKRRRRATAAGSADHLGSGDTIDLRRYASFAHELVRFAAPDHPSDEDSDLVRDIVVLDHRSLHAFGAHSQPRAEVRALLQNAVIAAGYLLFLGESPASTKGGARNIRAAVGLYAQAQAIFLRYLQSINRLWYVGGVFCGVLLLVLFAFGARLLMPAGVAQAVRPDLLTALIFFAGLGSIVSVLLRLSKLDVAKEVLRTVLIISGMGRPFVASAFAVVVYLLVHNKLIAVALTSDSDGTYFVIAFLCGFSERFAQDLLARVKVAELLPDDVAPDFERGRDGAPSRPAGEGPSGPRR